MAGSFALRCKHNAQALASAGARQLDQEHRNGFPGSEQAVGVKMLARDELNATSAAKGFAAVTLTDTGVE